MLVLTRGRDQEIVIGSDIRIRIGEIYGGRVKLLIEAPRHYDIRREEVVKARGTEMALASASG